MSLMVSIARISEFPDAARMTDFESAHRAVFGDCCDVPTLLRDPEDPNQIAVVANVRDLEALRSISRTPEGDAMMRRFGFLEQMSYFLEEA